jgi:hypothetical protein
MPDAVYEDGQQPTSASFMDASPGILESSGVKVVPCALIYIDRDGRGSPNSRSPDPFSYVRQAITLNRSLIAAGFPPLTIGTNARSAIDAYLRTVDEPHPPILLDLESSTVLPKTTRFYAAHFKLDLLEQASNMLPPRTLLLLLDTDMVAQHALDADVLQHCYRSGAGAFDISDQEFFAYGARRVVRDLETVAGRSLTNPRWFGGECLLATAAFIAQLVPRARECFQRYADVIDSVNHNGDEIFISAALNLLAEEGHQIIDVGSYQLVGRHWSGNTHRDLRWFRHCSLLHLPGRKSMLERQARYRGFSMGRIWRRLVLAHVAGRVKIPLARLLRQRRDRASARSLPTVSRPYSDLNRAVVGNGKSSARRSSASGA